MSKIATTHSTVHAAFATSAARTPRADFLFTESVTARAYGIDPGPIAWSEAAAQVQRLREAYRRAGHGHGHRVGLCTRVPALSTLVAEVPTRHKCADGRAR